MLRILRISIDFPTSTFSIKIVFVENYTLQTVNNVISTDLIDRNTIYTTRIRYSSNKNVRKYTCTSSANCLHSPTRVRQKIDNRFSNTAHIATIIGVQ